MSMASGRLRVRMRWYEVMTHWHSFMMLCGTARKELPVHFPSAHISGNQFELGALATKALNLVFQITHKVQIQWYGR